MNNKTNTTNGQEIQESELVNLARLGNAHAFELLADKYLLVLKWQIKQLNIPSSEKDDFIQEGLIGLLKAVRTYDGTSSAFTTYASVCIKNGIISAVRKYQKHLLNNVPYEGIPINYTDISDITPENDLINKEDVVGLYDKARMALSEYEIKIFELYLSGMTYREMAFRLKRSEKSVGNAVCRIRKKLKSIS